jgi:hypothetical protein
MNKEFNRMLKLAGLMTEGLYTSDAKAPMEGMPSGKMKKSELKAKIKEMMLPEETPGGIATREIGSMDEYDTQGLTNAASVVDHYLKTAYDAGSAGMGFDNNLAYEMMDHLEQFLGEMGSMEEDLFEAKKDEESDTEDVIVADTEEGEVPAEGDEDMTVTDTQVDVNMDGVPDVDTGSAESKKAFTSLVDTYNSAKELGDPKLTQMIANALTYYNKNIILKAGQPQA